MTILHEEGRDCQRDSKDGSLSVLTNVQTIADKYLVQGDTAYSGDDETILLAGIFDRLDKLVSIVEKIKIPRMLL